MAKEVILKMKEGEFNAFFEMANENAQSIGSADEIFANRNIKHLKMINRMLKRNNIDKQIDY